MSIKRGGGGAYYFLFTIHLPSLIFPAWILLQAPDIFNCAILLRWGLLSKSCFVIPSQPMPDVIRIFSHSVLSVLPMYCFVAIHTSLSLSFAKISKYRLLAFSHDTLKASQPTSKCTHSLLIKVTSHTFIVTSGFLLHVTFAPISQFPSILPHTTQQSWS